MSRAKQFPSLNKSLLIALSLLVLIFCVPKNTRAQETTELRCRGGADAFVIDKIGTDELSLNFNSSKKPAGADSSGLEPGTCSWINRTVKDDEWRQIHLVVTDAQAQSIPDVLKNRNNYWSFFVVNTDRGYFDAKSHQAWTPDPKQGTPGTQTPPQANAPPASFDGKWSMRSGSTPFTLILKQTGDKVTGAFSPTTRPDYGEGTLAGTVTGNTLSFQWTQAGGYKGTGNMAIAPDGKSLDGAMTITEGPTKGGNAVSATRADDAPQS